MVTLELFIAPHCISAPSAIAAAKEAVRQVPGARLIVRSDREDRARAKSLGVFIHPSFVLEGEVIAVGQPNLEKLIRAIRDKARESKEGTAVCEPKVSVPTIERGWEDFVHLAASVHSGHSSAISVLSRFGSTARGHPTYETGVHLGYLLRTLFLCDFFTKEPFPREILQVMNQGESVNSLKRVIHVGRVSSRQARREEEMRSVADGLTLLTNIVMSWNTMQMQEVLNRWRVASQQPIPSRLISRIAPTRIEGINLRGVFEFPIERFYAKLLPSMVRRPQRRKSS